MSVLTPKEIVAELDKYIIGQHEAKRKVAIALRNRWRRQQLSEGMRDEVTPKNIIMIGPTGVGKTEIARRLSKLADAPFIKVEASKFTEVGYVGRDCESMIRELTEVAVGMVRAEIVKEVESAAKIAAERRLLDLLHNALDAKALKIVGFFAHHRDLDRLVAKPLLHPSDSMICKIAAILLGLRQKRRLNALPLGCKSNDRDPCIGCLPGYGNKRVSVGRPAHDCLDFALRNPGLPVLHLLLDPKLWVMAQQFVTGLLKLGPHEIQDIIPQLDRGAAETDSNGFVLCGGGLHRRQGQCSRKYRAYQGLHLISSSVEYGKNIIVNC